MVCDAYATQVIRCNLKLNWPASSKVQVSTPPKFKFELSKFKFESLALPGSGWNLQVHWRLLPPPLLLRVRWLRLPARVTSTWQRQWQGRAVSCSQGLSELHAGAAATTTSRCPIIYRCSSSALAGNFAAVSEPRRHGPNPNVVSTGRSSCCFERQKSNCSTANEMWNEINVSAHQKESDFALVVFDADLLFCKYQFTFLDSYWFNHKA